MKVYLEGRETNFSVDTKTIIAIKPEQNCSLNMFLICFNSNLCTIKHALYYRRKSSKREA